MSTPATQDAVCLSGLLWAKIVATDESLEGCTARAGEAKAEWTQWRENIDDRRETLDAIKAELRKAHPDTALSLDETTRLFKADDDLQKAEDKWAVIDRKKRTLEDQVKKLTASVLTLIRQARNPDGLPYIEGNKADADAYKRVPLDCLMGDMLAMPYAKAGWPTVGDAVGALTGNGIKLAKAAGEVTPDQAAYLLAVIRDYLDRRGVKHALPAKGGSLDNPPPPPAKEPKEAPKAQDGAEGEPDAEEGEGDKEAPKSTEPRRLGTWKPANPAEADTRGPRFGTIKGDKAPSVGVGVAPGRPSGPIELTAAQSNSTDAHDERVNRRLAKEGIKNMGGAGDRQAEPGRKPVTSLVPDNTPTKPAKKEKAAGAKGGKRGR